MDKKRGTLDWKREEGSGKKAKFLHHTLLDGKAPRNLASHLFQLVKKKTLQQELANDTWIQTLQGKIATASQIE